MQQTKRPLAVFMLLALSSPVFGQGMHESRIPAGQPMPPFDMQTVDGKRLTSQGLKGKIVLLDFWATWCAPCRLLGKELNLRLKPLEGNPDFVFIGMNYGEDTVPDAKGDPVKYWQKSGYVHPLTLKNDAYASLVGAGLPSAYVINADGVLYRAWHAWSPSTADEITAAVFSLLKDPHALPAARAERPRMDAGFQRPIREARRAGDWQKVLAEVQKAEAAHPGQAATAAYRFEAWLHTDPARALAFARTWRSQSGAANEVEVLGQIGQGIASVAGLPREHYLYGAECLDTLITRHLEVAHDVDLWQALGRCRFRAGDIRRGNEAFDRVIVQLEMRKEEDHNPARLQGEIDKLREEARQYAEAAATRSSQAPQDRLQVGHPAPPLRDVRWVQGGPVEAHVPGKVHVVEFWATWCGPCVAAMPHLSELARRHADEAVFTGVSILEDNHGEKGAEAALRKANAFMSKNPGRMTYNVCVDSGSRDSHMASAWLTAAGLGGIPTTFVVGRDGRIAWIGHPNALDDVLPGVIAGTFDPARFEAAQQARRQAAMQERTEKMALLAPAEEALKARDYRKALELLAPLEGRLAYDPIVGEVLMRSMTVALLESKDEAGLRAFMERSLARGENSFSGLDVADRVARVDGLQPKTHALAARLADAFVAGSAAAYRTPRPHATAAANYFKAGDSAAAVARQESAIEAARVEAYDEAKMRPLEDALKLYKSFDAGG